MSLVVASQQTALAVYCEDAVVVVPVLPPGRAGNQAPAALHGPAQRLDKRRLRMQQPGDRRFGPDHGVRLGACGSEAHQTVQMSGGVLSAPFLGLRDIGLDEAQKRTACSFGWRSAAEAKLSVSEHRRNRERGRGPCPPVGDGQEKADGKRRQPDSIDADDRGRLLDRRNMQPGISEQVPGKAGQQMAAQPVAEAERGRQRQGAPDARLRQAMRQRGGKSQEEGKQRRQAQNGRRPAGRCCAADDEKGPGNPVEAGGEEPEREGENRQEGVPGPPRSVKQPCERYKARGQGRRCAQRRHGECGANACGRCGQ